MKNNTNLFRAAKIAGAMTALFLASGQVSAHVSYGHALYDDSGTNPGGNGGTVAEETVMHVATGNKGTASCQGAGCASVVTSVTASGNAGWLEAQNPNLWANSHDSRFMWFYISKPTVIQFSITGNANADYTSTMPGSTLGTVAIDTLNPAYNLFYGAVPHLSHDGAYGSFNTGFAQWSSWAQAALPAGQKTYLTGPNKNIRFIGTGATTSEGNAIYNRPYTTDAGSLNLPSQAIAAGTTQHMGTYGGFKTPGTCPSGAGGFWMANSVTQVTYGDGSPLTDHSACLEFVRGASSSTNVLNSNKILLTKPGVYTLIVGGANRADYNQLVADAKLTGMGPEGCATDASGNCLNGSAATATDWDRYKNMDRRARSFTIQFSGTPK
ncbi:hypothetical protein [Methylomagnum ishizawai]|uniref:hypothetical protein n=1 Tax=Methylomagnum ishizawai TaxID=1760988 RepID=UPI001C3291EE|nr:hypothetical protein [Methylomagnum ishizawai]BBL74686.1 hypothetical protein MishRS11D_17840 [Methylomagnum ishizawai]